MRSRRSGRRRFTATERRRLVDAWRRSGLSQGRFAREHGFPASYLSRWKLEFLDSVSPVVDLVPVRVVDPAPQERAEGGAFVLRLPSGIGVEVGAGFDANELRRLVAVLGSLAC